MVVFQIKSVRRRLRHFFQVLTIAVIVNPIENCVPMLDENHTFLVEVYDLLPR